MDDKTALKMGVPLKDLEAWLKHEEEARMFLEDEANNNNKLFAWKKKKVVNILPSLAFTAGLFLGGFCLIAGLDWVNNNFTEEQILSYSKIFMGVFGFLVIWFFIWKVTNPLKPRTYFRTPKKELDN